MLLHTFRSTEVSKYHWQDLLDSTTLSILGEQQAKIYVLPI